MSTRFLRSEQRFNRGQCVSCGKRDHRPNLRTCQVCQDRSNQYLKKYRETHVKDVKASLAQSKNGSADPFKALAIAVWDRAIQDLKLPSSEYEGFYPSHFEKTGARDFLLGQGEYTLAHKFWFQFVQEDIGVGTFKNRVQEILSGGNRGQIGRAG
jgi:hypothetical protein